MTSTKKFKIPRLQLYWNYTHTHIRTTVMKLIHWRWAIVKNLIVSYSVVYKKKDERWVGLIVTEKVKSIKSCIELLTWVLELSIIWTVGV